MLILLLTFSKHGTVTLHRVTDISTTPWAIKKGATFIFTITFANVDRFQQFFHFWIRR